MLDRDQAEAHKDDRPLAAKVKQCLAHWMPTCVQDVCRLKGITKGLCDIWKRNNVNNKEKVYSS